MRYYILFSLMLLFPKIIPAQVPDTIICATDNSQITTIGALINTTYTLKVLLVDFTDIKHDATYNTMDWNNLFFSQKTYYSPSQTNPDGESVYGSMRDYYSMMSNGVFEITGYLLNIDENADGKPEWITLPNTKKYYNLHSNYSFRNTAKNAATSLGYNVSTNSNTKLVIIYAGHMYRTGGGLHPRATGNEYVMSEKFSLGAPYDSEHPNATFSGIGVHCHEFGHLLGWRDTYGGTTSNTFWSLMASGKSQKANAPAPVSPEFRIKKGWVTPVVVINDTTANLTYNLKTPNVYKISDNADPNRYFLIENRSFVSTMDFNGVAVRDYNNFVPWNLINNPSNLPKQGLLVWSSHKIADDPSYTYTIQADGYNNSTTPYNTAPNDANPSYYSGDSGDPFPGYGNNYVFSPWSYSISNATGPSPVSYPTTNVGFEIVEMGSSYIKAALYALNPINASPHRPWDFAGVALSNGNPSLSWSANSEPDFSRYELWRSTTELSGYGKIADITNIATTSYQDTNCPSSLPEGKAYYKLRAVDSQNKTSVFTAVETIDVSPDMVQNFNISTASFGSTSRPKLTWTLNTENDMAGYQIERKIGSGNWTIPMNGNVSSSTSEFVDMEIVIGQHFNGQTASYRIRAYDLANLYSDYSPIRSINFNIMFEVGNTPIARTIKNYNFYSNYPNPFNPSTEIAFDVPELSDVILEVYSLSGEKIASLIHGFKEKGSYRVTFDGANLASGIYINRFSARGQKSGKRYNAVKRMLLIK